MSVLMLPRRGTSSRRHTVAPRCPSPAPWPARALRAARTAIGSRAECVSPHQRRRRSYTAVVTGAGPAGGDWRTESAETPPRVSRETWTPLPRTSTPVRPGGAYEVAVLSPLVRLHPPGAAGRCSGSAGLRESSRVHPLVGYRSIRARSRGAPLIRTPRLSADGKSPPGTDGLFR
jgi:hypothetical protein